MARIPLSARAQLERAHELGHDLFVQEKKMHEATHPSKFYVSCSCGWKSVRVWRSRAAASSAMASHLGRVIAEGA